MRGLAAALFCACATPHADTRPVPIAGLPAESSRTPPPSRDLGPAPPRAEPAPQQAMRPSHADATVDLELAAAPLADAFRLLAEAGGFDVVIDESVDGEVSLRLRDAAVDDTIESLAAANGLTLEWQGNVLVVRGRSGN